jgi:hypothetical protein
VRVLLRYSLRAAVFQKVGLKMMKAAAAVRVGRKWLVLGVVFLWSSGRVCFFVYVIGELGSYATRTHGPVKTYPISWVG